MNLPKNYNKILQKTYPDVRMRWSGAREEWLLERRAYFARLDVNPDKYPADAVDTFTQHRDGYYLAGSYPARRLPPVEKLVAFLSAMDPVKLGYGPDSGDLLAAELEKREEIREEERYGAIKREFVESGADELMTATKIASYVPRSLPE